MSRFVLFGAASLAALALAACGDNMSSNTAATTTPTVTADAGDHDAAVKRTQDFINQAGQASLVEIRTSEMALKTSKSADVKVFAQMMIDQHKANGDKLKAAASAAALAPPMEMLDDYHMTRINDLEGNKDAAAFDADYMHLQVDVHNDAIKLFDDFARDAHTIPQLKTFADETLPTLSAHKAEAERVEGLVKTAGNSSAPS